MEGQQGQKRDTQRKKQEESKGGETSHSTWFIGLTYTKEAEVSVMQSL